MGTAAFAALNGPLETLAMLQPIQREASPLRVAQVYRVRMCAVFSGLLLACLAAPALTASFGLVPVIGAGGAACVGVGCLGLWLQGRNAFDARAEGAAP